MVVRAGAAKCTAPTPSSYYVQLDSLLHCVSLSELIGAETVNDRKTKGVGVA